MDTKFRSLEILNLQSTSSVFHIHLSNPSNHNAFTSDFFTELPQALSLLDSNPDVSVIVLSSPSKHFCSGIDLNTLGTVVSPSSSDRGRVAEQLRRHIKSMQDSITAVEKCRKPVIAAVHGACIGGGIDLITACDIRYCTESAFFSVKEVDVGITADLGTLQRLPKIVGLGMQWSWP